MNAQSEIDRIAKEIENLSKSVDTLTERVSSCTDRLRFYSAETTEYKDPEFRPGDIIIEKGVGTGDKWAYLPEESDDNAPFHKVGMVCDSAPVWYERSELPNQLEIRYRHEAND